MRGNQGAGHGNNNQSQTIQLPKPGVEMDDVAGAQDTIYLCNFRVSTDGEWLCLRELQDMEYQDENASKEKQNTSANSGISNDRNDEKFERDYANYSRDPAAIERSNLVNICKLVVKELLEQSLRFGRMLDSDHLPLQHFFIVLEHVLRHGLRPKKGLLGPKKELWDILQSVEKYCFEAQDITTCVRDLPTVRTHMGRARAWLRIALMQKKLADYLQALIEHKDVSLAEYYEPHALMMSDEIIIIMRILFGLNVIDCNLCFKEVDLDTQQGVIDFSLYLRSSSRSSPEGDIPAISEESAAGHMTAVLDQKNYIEELNRHLNATVANLQSKVESLTTTNALMKEDLAIARNSLMALKAENMALRRSSQHGNSDNSDNFLDRFDPEMTEILTIEKKKRREVERELEIQMSLKAETEMAMKLLEKDIHEKEESNQSLQNQLDDIKQINLELYTKLQECEYELTQKGDMVARLQVKASQIGKLLQSLERNKSEKNETSSGKSGKDRPERKSLHIDPIPPFNANKVRKSPSAFGTFPSTGLSATSPTPSSTEIDDEPKKKDSDST